MGIVSGGGGGAAYTPPTARELIASGGNVLVANGGTGFLKWSHDEGSALLDYTTNTLPSAVASGVYAIGIETNPGSAMTAGGSFDGELDFDAPAGDFVLANTSPPAVAAKLQPTLLLTATCYLAAGQALRIVLVNHDGVSDLVFRINRGIVQRVS